MDHCPSEQALHDLLNERLSPAETSTLEAHLEGCAHCQQTLEKLVASPPADACGATVNPHAPRDGDAAFLRRLEKKPLRKEPLANSRTVFGTPPKAFGAGPDVAGYEILGVLGQGGMGVVYKAWQKELKRFVALKMVLSGAYAGTEELERFCIEAEAAARLQHPNIVQVHEVGNQDGRPFLALEFVNGLSLAQAIKRTPVPAAAAAQLVETLARAMHYAHQRGIIHRDLKPANILLSADDTEPPADAQRWSAAMVPKITDFGLAKLMVGGSDQTRTGSVLGTPSYMAPEQAGGRTKDISTAVDVYALGAILYELLAGRPPFRGESVAQTLQQVLTEEPTAPHRLQRNVPRDLETICLKCLEKDPRRRYASASDLAEDLRRFRADESIQARPSTATQLLWKWAKRHPAAAALLCVVAVSTTTLFAGGWWYQNELENSLANVTIERDKARDARIDAELKHAEADAQRIEAEQQRDEAQKNLYLAHIPQAFGAWNAAHLERMTEILTDVAPRSPKQKDLRNFEWHYLRRLPFNHVQLKGHTEPVNAVAFRPDGVQLASAGSDGTIRIWDPDTHVENMAPIAAHKGRVTAVAYSPDCKWLASAGQDKRICLWDADTGKFARTVGVHGGWAYHVAFRPDGKALASVSADKTIKLWDLEKEGEPRTVTGHTKQATAVAFSNDGKQLASGSADRMVRLWDLDKKTPQARTLAPQGGWVYAVIFSPDGKTIYSASFDDVVARNTATGKDRFKRLAHSGQVRGITLSADGTRLASACFDQSVRIWDALDGALLLRFKGHVGNVNGVAFHPDGKRLASAGDDHTVRIWDATGPQEYRAGPKHETAPVQVVAFSPDNKRLFAGGADNLIQVFDVALGKQEAPFAGHKGSVHALALRSDGKQIASAGVDRVIRLWDVKGRESVRQFDGHKGRVTALAFSPDDRSIASSSFDGKVRLWSLADENASRIMPGHVGRALGVAFSPDGKAVASCGDDKMIYLWDPATGAKLDSLKGQNGWVHCIAFSPNGKSLASGGADGAILIWDLATKKAVPLEGHTGRVSSIAFTPDGLRLASIGFFDKLVKIWDVPRGKELLALNQLRTGHAIAFSPNGHLLASAGADQTVRIWDGTPLP